MSKLKMLFAILGGIWVSIQIYSWMQQPKLDISATIEIIDYTLPFDLEKELSYEIISDKVDSLYTLLQKQSNNSLPYNSKTYLRDFITDQFHIDFLKDFSNEYKTLGILQVLNSGDKEIQDIELSLKQEFLYEFSNSSGTIYRGVGTGKINIGNLRPTEEITIRLWSTIINDGNIHITFPEGVIKPEQISKVTGLLATLSILFPNLWLSFMIILIILLLGIIIYRWGYHRGYQQNISMNMDGIDGDKNKTEEEGKGEE